MDNPPRDKHHQRFGVLFAFYVCFMLYLTCSLPFVLATNNIPANWIEGLGQGVTFADMETIPVTNEIVIVGTLNLTLTGGSPLMNNVLNLQEVTGDSTVGFISLINSEGFPSWTRLIVDSSPTTITWFDSFLRVVVSFSNSMDAAVRSFSQSGTLAASSHMANTKVYASYVDKSTNSLYFTGTIITTTASRLVVLKFGSAINGVLASSFGSGRNAGVQIVTYNGIFGLSITVEGTVTLGSVTLNAASYYVVFDSAANSVLEYRQHARPYQVTAAQNKFYSLAFDGISLYQWADSSQVTNFSSTSLGGSLEIYGIDGGSSMLAITGRVSGTVTILGNITISSRENNIPDGFACKVLYPIGGNVTVCEVFGSQGLSDFGALVTVDSGGNTIIAAQTGFNNTWGDITLPRGYGNLVVSLGAVSNTNIILSQNIVNDTVLETNYRYLIHRPISVNEGINFTARPGAVVMFSGNGTMLFTMNSNLIMEGTPLSRVQIRSLGDISQPRVTFSGSSIQLINALVYGSNILTTNGTSLVKILNCVFEDVGEFTIQILDPSTVNFHSNKVSSARSSSLNPIIHVTSLSSVTSTFIGNTIQLNGTLSILKILSNYGSITISNNTLVGHSMGVRVDTLSSTLAISTNKFTSFEDPLSINTEGTSSISRIKSNEFKECTGPVRVNKVKEGLFYIQNNIFSYNNASSILEFGSENNCSRPILISDNVFSENIISNQVVSLKFPQVGCKLSDFRNNKILNNTLFPTFTSLVSVSGDVSVHRNHFQYVSDALVNRGPTILDTQFNYWGTTDPDEVRLASGNPSSTQRNITSLYSPYIDQTGVVFEVDFFNATENKNILDCKSVNDMWPGVPSAVYRINPYCQSILVRCNMLSLPAIVLQRRKFFDTDFNVNWTTYEQGFGDLDGDFFLGLQNFYLMMKLASGTTILNYWKFLYEPLTTVGTMSIGPPETDYALTINATGLVYTNVPFGTTDHGSNNETLACANQQQSGWWFGSCSNPNSWNLNALQIYAHVGLDTITASDWMLVSAKDDRDAMICDSAKTCFNHSQTDPDVCSGHGTCVSLNTCMCYTGFTGFDCRLISVTVSDTLTKFCEDAEFTTNMFGVSYNQSIKYTYVWSMYQNSGMKPGVDEYLASQNTKSIVLPARFMGISLNEIQVEVFDQGAKIGEARKQFTMPQLVIDSSNIDVGDSHIYARQYESYSFLLTTRNLPICANNETKRWTVNGAMYETFANKATISITPTESGTIYLTLTLLSSVVQANVSISVIPARPVTIISGGNRMVASFHNHTIDASKSYDLTVSSNATSNFYWSCDKCTNFVSSNRSTVIFNEDVGIYSLSVTFYPDILVLSRRSSSQVILTVVDDLSDIPIPQISTVFPNLLDARHVLRIGSSVSKNRPNHLLDYEWIVLRKEKNEQTVISGSSFNVVPLVLWQGFLKPNSSYVFTYRVRYRNFTNFGEASVTAKTASASSIRSISCSPCNGTALWTQFELSLDSTDLVEYYPLQYSFSYLDPSSKRYIPLQGISTSATIRTMLPNLNSRFIIVQGVVTNFFGIDSTAQLNISMAETDTSSILRDLVSNLDKSTSSDVLTSITGSLKTILVNNQSNTIVEQVLSFMSDSLDRETTNSTISISTATLNINAIETLTDLTTSSMVLNITHMLVDKLIVKCDQGNLELKDSTTQSLANVVSNLMGRYGTEGSNPMIPTISKVSTWIAHSKWISENQTNIATDTFQLSVKKETGDTIRGTDIYTKDVQVILPRNISVLTSEQVYIVQSVSFNGTFNPYRLTGSHFSTPIVDFEIKQEETKIKLSDLEYPLQIVLKKEVEKQNSSSRFECRFMDETTNSSWFTNGCWLYEEDDASVTCHCYHTTSFSALIIYDPKAPNKASDGLYVISIIINSLLALISLAFLVVCFVWRRKQPIKSRFLAPHIGLGAIIVECILNGIIRNSLLIAANNANDYRGINSISYLILTIVNPIVLLSLFIYFWQMLRYFLLKNLYAIMNIEKRNLKKIQFLKMLSSKLVYIALGKLVFSASCTYFVVISILEATDVIKPNAASTVNALSFSILSLTLGALIVATFIWDCTIILSRKLFKREMKKMSEGNADLVYLKRIVTTIMNHFKSDDPLMFRIESVFMVAAMMVMTISYIVGISDRFDSRASPNSAAKIIEFLFDILYISLRIMAFGGLSVLIRFIQRVRLHREHENYARLKQYMSELKTGTSTIESQLQNMLRDEYGYSAISTYAKKEFALENVLLWKRLEEVRSDNITASVERRKKHLQDLYDDCIARGSPFECNLPSKVVKNYRKLMDQAEVTAAEAEGVFLSVFNEVLVNICDTFTRFSVSPEYAQYQQVRDMSKELHDNNFKNENSSESLVRGL